MGRPLHKARTGVVYDLMNNLDLSIDNIVEKHQVSDRTVYRLAHMYGVNTIDRHRLRMALMRKQAIDAEVAELTMSFILASPNVSTDNSLYIS